MLSQKELHDAFWGNWKADEGLQCYNVICHAL